MTVCFFADKSAKPHNRAAVRFFILFLCYAILLASCSRREDMTPPEKSENSAPSASSEFENSDNQDNDDPTEQPDPTLPENQEGGFYRWDHVEYKDFGSFSDYAYVDLELHSHRDENAGNQAEIINAVMRLPVCCFVDEYGGVINYDGDFENGTIKIGGPPSDYYQLRDGETIRENNSDSYSYESYAANPMSGERYDMLETRENRVGGYYQSERFMRYIGKAIGPAETHLLQYVIDLGDDYLTGLYFFVSPKATKKDLELYDAIADSVEIVK